MDKNMRVYILVSYAWSYVLWGLAIYLGVSNNLEVLLNENFVEAIYGSNLTGEILLIALLALSASYGPLIGALVVRKLDKEFLYEFNKRIILFKSIKMYLVVAGIFLVIGLLPSIPLWFLEGSTDIGFIQVLLLLVTFFIIQLMTSGTEEFGWRGYMLPEFLKREDAWSASFKTGIIWALWHAPIVFYIFYTQGMPVFAMVFSFVGFSAGIVAMSVVHCYFYVKTQSVLFSVYVHAIGNTIPLIAGLVVMNAYKVAIVSQLLIWVVVFFIIKKNPVMFKNDK